MALFRSTVRFLSSSVVKRTPKFIPSRPSFARHVSTVCTLHINDNDTQSRCVHRRLHSPFLHSARYYSEPSVESEWYCVGFEDLRNHVRKEDVLLVDVREPHELQTYGFIPTSVNIPLRELNDALSMSAEMFQARYGRSLPSAEGAEIIFHCMAGVRSKRALQLAWDRGFAKARHYPGGFDEWEIRTKKKD